MTEVERADYKKELAYKEAIEKLFAIEKSYELPRYYFIDMLKPKEYVLDLIVAGKFVK